MADTADIIADFIDGFDEIREEALPEGVRVFLLEATPSGAFSVIREITGGWLVEYGQTRNEIKLLVATNEAGFNDDFVRASYIAYGVPSADSELSVYVILPDERDTTEPDLTSPFWTAAAIREPKERFLVV
jgi:hypothetical protein